MGIRAAAKRVSRRTRKPGMMIAWIGIGILERLMLQFGVNVNGLCRQVEELLPGG